MKRDVVLVCGCRPNFMKIAPIYKELKRRDIDTVVYNTYQHNSPIMNSIFMDIFEIKAKDIYVEKVKVVENRVERLQMMIKSFSDFLVSMDEEPIVIMVGDVDTTLAAALACSNCSIENTCHVEAGLRSYDFNMPEEMNRIVTDHVCEYLFAHSEDAMNNLKREGSSLFRYDVGNVMIDTLVASLTKVRNIKLDFCDGKFILVTLHRPENVDDEIVLEKILSQLSVLTKTIPVVFSVHPRTMSRIEKWNMKRYLKDFIVKEPMGYLEFMKLVDSCDCVITDSGGLQEEASYLGKRCMTVRKNTERPVTLKASNRLVDYEKIYTTFMEQDWGAGEIPKNWDGASSIRIVDILEQKIL